MIAAPSRKVVAHDIRGFVVRSTPGYTLSHCSLLVRLPEIGPMLISGDCALAHNRANLENRRLPSSKVDHAAIVALIDKVERLPKAEGAAIWLNHDIVQSGMLPNARPAFAYAIQLNVKRPRAGASGTLERSAFGLQSVIAERLLGALSGHVCRGTQPTKQLKD